MLSIDNQHLRPNTSIYLFAKILLKTLAKVKARSSITYCVVLPFGHLDFIKRNELATNSIQTLAEYNTSPT